jgi:hypothetical protein
MLSLGTRRTVSEALSYQLRLSLETIVRELQQLRIVSYLGRGSMRNILADYQKGSSWSDIVQNDGSRINELTTWIGEFIRTTNALSD